MSWKKRVLAAFCAVALLFTLSPPPARASSDIIFFAINEWMPPKLSASTMPIYYYNTYYVPYTLLDKNYLSATYGVNVDLGFNVAATNNRILLYNKRRQLTYDLDSGSCTDKGGNSYKRAAVIGGITYLPIYAVREFFAEDGLSFSQLATSYGPLLRITTPSAILDDALFIDATTLSLPDMIKKYNASLTPSPSPSASPLATPSPSPSASPGQEPDKRGVKVYLSFQCSGGTGTTALLDQLDREGIFALFFFSPESLAENEALVRRIVGSGHAIGLTVPGGPTEDAKALLTEGNRLLSLIAHTSTRTVLLENGDSAASIALDAAGWNVWASNVPASPEGKTASAYTAAIMRIVDAKKAVARITLPDQALTASALPPLINALQEEKYDLRLAVGGVFG